jgi:fumarylacetoacetase
MDRTHDPARISWVESANGHADFPIQNLPLGVFSLNGDKPRAGVAIGDFVLDIARAKEHGLIDGAVPVSGPVLNEFLALGEEPRTALRRIVSDLLDAEGAARPRLEALAGELLHPLAGVTPHLPASVGDYTDFYAGIHHAVNVGRLFRPDTPLLPNYKHVPIGYHGRASSIVASGHAVRRPMGQHKRGEAAEPSFGPSERLDFELELGIWIGPGNALGEPVPIAGAAAHIAGYCLLNDWSARDIQAWEYQPLGPFLAKNFVTTVSPWIITPEALEPFRRPQPARPDGDPRPFDYLWDDTDQAAGALDIALEVSLSTARSRARSLAPHPVARSNAANLYWTPAQLVAHHASGGCNLRPGDLLGTGTISGPADGGCGSMLELANGGRRPVMLPWGEQRRFLEDGDEVVFRASCRAPGAVPIGFGECRGRVASA